MLFSVGLSLVVLLSVVGAATVERVEYDYYKYHPMPEITDWMVQAVKDYPEVVTILEYGQTYEKRTISLLKIGVNTGEKKKAIWMDCGIHAREWIAPAFCQYFVKEILQAYKTDPKMQAMMTNMDFYTDTSTPGRTTRLDCGGRTDLNRNFNANWGTLGISFECCDNTFCGIKPVSEPEAQAVTYFVGNRKEDFLCFLNIHSYGQLLLVPFGHPNFTASNYDELMKVGRGAADAIRSVHGKDYTVGTSPDCVVSSRPARKAYSGALHIITYAHDKTFSGATATAATLWSMLLALGVTGTTLM
ncbi:hypothetical protein KUCAC02_000936 [Chaenocephalus aceratus]|uniref:Uncharacterized protein n=1 Tax=Chaenocephalus aceratus TaxID=36190 RepID=A0ACB9XVH1_CHAAC|nr:hypothetical protein KUCAC02_000936 [Chaenocephalus aceratus]